MGTTTVEERCGDVDRWGNVCNMDPGHPGDVHAQRTAEGIKVWGYTINMKDGPARLGVTDD